MLCCPFNRHPGCQCPTGFEGSHCENLSGELGSSSTTETGDNAGDDGKSDGSLSTVGIILIVFFVDIVLLLSIGATIYRRRQRRVDEKEFGSHPTNLMARDTQEPPTLDNILAIGSLPDDSSVSSMQGSSQRSSQLSCTRSMNGDGLYRVEDGASKDLVNVAII